MTERKTVRVRIAVATLHDGNWNAVGYGYPEGCEDSDTLRARALEVFDLPESPPLVTWVEATVELPPRLPDEAVIEGEVSDDD